MPLSGEAKKAYNIEYHRKRRANDSAYVQDNKDRCKQHHRDRMEWLKQYKTPCIVCGESEPCVIDFHHITESNKTSEVATMMRQSMSKAVILEEVNKCVTLCANCHRKVHSNIIQLEDYLN